MTNERLQQIKERVERRSRQAEKILEGGENYDGADGARYVSDLCDICRELYCELEKGTEVIKAL